MTDTEYLTHKITQRDADPFLVHNSQGNLKGHYATLNEARKAVQESRIKELINELYDVSNLRGLG